jgi:hypothetical protein
MISVLGNRKATAKLMNIKAKLHGLKALAPAALAVLLLSAPGHSYAQGHFGGGGHAAGGYGGGGFHGGYRAGGGWRGGYGWHGGYYGYGWGYGWGWPGYGLFLATLPLYYSTLWWDGVPYYYADDSYYVWNSTLGGYESVPPPGQAVTAAPPGAGMSAGMAAGMGPATGELFAYPKQSQSEEQQARDKQECRSWAATQAGSDGASANSHSDNLRAQTACLEARGYSVR